MLGRKQGLTDAGEWQGAMGTVKMTKNIIYTRGICQRIFYKLISSSKLLNPLPWANSQGHQSCFCYVARAHKLGFTETNLLCVMPTGGSGERKSYLSRWDGRSAEHAVTDTF